MLASMMTNSAIMIAIVTMSAAFTTQSIRRRIVPSRRPRGRSAQRHHALDHALVDTLAVFRPELLAGGLPLLHFRGRRLVDLHLLVDQLLTEFALEAAIHLVCFFRRVGRRHQEFLPDRFR